MRKQSVNKNTSDEIDFGQLKQLSKRGFPKFFNFVASIFKGLSHFLILFLPSVQKNFIVLMAALVVGAVRGCFLDKPTREKMSPKW